jgi:hypothetical protein
MSKSINVEITTQEQRDQLIEQLKEMSFDKEVNSWEDYLETITSTYTREAIENTAHRMASAGSHYRALYKLEHLKTYYNDGWEPVWSQPTNKFCIVYVEDKLRGTYTNRHSFLVFKTIDIRRKFMRNHSDLINQAKPLL